ncbi:uncharacterized protein PHACADRAFT_203589 [Phanerochaete carnosa HHB-10118-sp]|uniref:Uncharacterized protein n=1 Tax=Phanerochaete carnosa (strain HHB-10118-sp) TaxID=650164 RepID=K5VBT8_PHACS|nr:uncharacterized protein PHACADRAFT_203589 [Phanerochaete carnosa HHB-10118-sp]EKM60376.1 hypothetical protein PHACADRAFT_203589 [Phanerochaete carnosa HHB-10118-sp]
MAVIIESALLFTAASVMLVITYFTHSYAAFTCLGIASPLIGIAYCLIIAHFGLRGAFKTKRPMLSSIYLPPLRSSHSATPVMPVVINATTQSGTVRIGDIDLGPKTPQALRSLHTSLSDRVQA